MIPNPVHHDVNDEGLNFSETGFLTGLRSVHTSVLRRCFLLLNLHALVHIQTEGSVGIHMLIEERC
jgi:hypothetical protein